MKLLKYVLSFFPSTIPVGMQEFDAWALEIRSLIGKGFEQVPQDDFKYVLATTVIHLGPQKDSMSKRFFVKTLRKGAANQIASQVFQDVRTKQKAAEAAKQTEATGQPGASDGKEVQASNS